MTDFALLHTSALAAAQAAATAEDGRLGDEQSRGFDCGFAWVQLTPGNHPYVRYLKSAHTGSKHWAKGWELWGPGLHCILTQSISVHVEAARAYVETIMAAKIDGLTATVGQRWD